MFLLKMILEDDMSLKNQTMSEFEIYFSQNFVTFKIKFLYVTAMKYVVCVFLNDITINFIRLVACYLFLNYDLITSYVYNSMNLYYHAGLQTIFN